MITSIQSAVFVGASLASILFFLIGLPPRRHGFPVRLFLSFALGQAALWTYALDGAYLLTEGTLNFVAFLALWPGAIGAGLYVTWRFLRVVRRIGGEG